MSSLGGPTLKKKYTSILLIVWIWKHIKRKDAKPPTALHILQHKFKPGFSRKPIKLNVAQMLEIVFVLQDLLIFDGFIVAQKSWYLTLEK